MLFGKKWERKHELVQQVQIAMWNTRTLNAQRAALDLEVERKVFQKGSFSLPIKKKES